MNDALKALLDEAQEHAFETHDELDGTVLAVGKALELIERAFAAGCAAWVTLVPPRVMPAHYMGRDWPPLCRPEGAPLITSKIEEVTCPECAGLILAGKHK